MHKMLVIGLFTLMLVSYACAVSELTDDNFYGYATQKDVLLVNFYAPWCSDCTKLAPEFEGAGASLGPRSTDLAKVDCFGAGKGLCQMYGIKSWPQLKNFHHGTYTGDYSGEQTSDAIANYINTVENSNPNTEESVATNSNPYAMAYPETNVAVQSKPMVAPVITATSCAKCKIEKPRGKIAKHCSHAMRKQCIARHPTLTKAQQKYGEDD